MLIPKSNVGVRRLELPTSTSRTWRANQLCYTPSQKFDCKDKPFFLFRQNFCDFFERFLAFSQFSRSYWLRFNEKRQQAVD